jgi:hypothetical protein
MQSVRTHVRAPIVEFRGHHTCCSWSIDRARCVYTCRMFFKVSRSIRLLAIASTLVACSPTPSVADAGHDSASSADGSVDLCSASLASTSRGCDPAMPVLSTEPCRCGSKFYWDGMRCAPTAACRCTSHCDLLFDTQDACENAYAACRDASTSD